MKVDLPHLRDLERQGYLKSRPHPTMNRLIWNYTAKCNYDRHWTDVTMMCRGLITDSEGNIIERPLRKFFNLDEHERLVGPLPDEEPTVWDKLDGSLGIAYLDRDGMYSLATRGSFESPQAVEGTKILRKRYSNTNFNPLCTYLFEIIYPGNRIVVDYGDRRDLVLVAVIDTQTGESAPSRLFYDMAARHGLETAEHFGTAIPSDRTNAEGVVLHYEQADVRVKVKYEEYKQLHRIITHASSKTIWERLQVGPEEAVWQTTSLPGEFQKWAESTAEKIQAEFDTLAFSVLTAFNALDKTQPRKDLALYILAHHKPISGLLFSLLDGKDISEQVWKAVKPKREFPYFTETEGAQ